MSNRPAKESVANECTPLFFAAKDVERDLRVARAAFVKAQRELTRAELNYSNAVAARRHEMTGGA